jgi:hypothetical protein
MTLNSEFQSLYKRWREKADQYNTEDLYQLFDKFFSLYVLYNALYVEAAAYLRRKAISEGTEVYKLNNDQFPDKESAIHYVVAFLKSRSLLNMIESHPATKEALEQLKAFMNEENSIRLWICLDPVWGEPQKEKDKELYRKLNSPSTDERAKAILTVIYQVRCNMFHGRKSVRPVQKELLIPIVTILEKVVDKLYEKLKNVGYVPESAREETPQRTTFHKALLASGLVKQLKQPSNSQPTERRLIQVQGKPVSETIIEERR